MKDSNHLEAYKDPVEEARRYVQNAKDILNDNGKLDTELQLYEYRKYVRMAGNTLWNGVLLILDAVFHVKNNKRQHPDVSKQIHKPRRFSACQRHYQPLRCDALETSFCTERSQ